MWSSVKTEAVVLFANVLREADREYRALTPGHGKLSFIGRGALKPRAKLAAHLEPCAIVELEIVRGMRSTTVIGVERMHAFRRMASSIDHRLLALTSMSLLDRVTHVEEEDRALYEELVTWLHFLETQEALHPTRSTMLLGGFMLRVMRQLGYDVSLQHCVGCREEIMPLSFRWHGGKGGLVCTDCVRRAPHDWLGSISLREEVVSLMRLARDASYGDLTRFGLKAVDVEAFATCVHDLLGFHVPGYAERPFWVGIAVK